jgi:hypothetical protein
MTKTNETLNPKLVAAAMSGFLPYLAGGLLITITRNLLWLALAGALSAASATYGSYVVRKVRDPEYARGRLIVDPMLFGAYFVFSAVIVRYLFLH